MDRATAARRIRKLEAVADPARGATQGERTVASRKAAELRQRFGIHETRQRPRPQRRPPRRPFTAPVHGPATAPWEFNVQTGEKSPNVRVVHHSSPGNWKIEIDL